MSVRLGETYKDTLHTIEGIATAKTEYITGCTRVLLERVKDGQVQEMWFDETRLSGPGLADAPLVEASKVDPGGPGAVAPSRDPA